MKKNIIEFIDSQENVYIVNRKEIVVTYEDYDIGRRVIGTNRRGVIFDYFGTYCIEDWIDIKDYLLVSVLNDEIICIFDCETLESKKLNILIN